MPFHLENQILKSVFPFHIAFDRGYKIIQFGQSIPKLVPSLNLDDNFAEIFQIIRPRTIQGKIENIIKNIDSLFVVKIIANQIELKGQMVYSSAEETFLFICHPIIKEQALLNTWGLTINDFAIYDQTTDFLFLLQSNKKTMEDLQEFSNQLDKQNKDLNNLTYELQDSFNRLQASEEEQRQNTEELKTINEDLEHARELLTKQKKELEAKNQDILSSINYARRIQDAILPTPNFMQTTFPHSFIFFLPKDILSGDFYWAASKKNKALMAVVDCTGHGVPGAFMSIIVENLLDQIVNEQNITEPDLVLEHMHTGLQRFLNQEQNINNETADVAICVVDKKNKILEYAGAKIPLYLVKNGEFSEIKADKFSVGGRNETLTERNFTKHFISLDNEITFYLSTDGFKDQFGGENKRKFLSANFKNLLFKVSDKPMNEQKIVIDDVFDAWKGEQKQTDDVLVVGIRV